MVGIATERGVAPGAIDRILRRAPASAQFGNKKIVDVVLFQTGSQGSFAKLRQASGTGKAPHIRHGLYSIVLEQLNKRVDGARGVPNRPDGVGRILTHAAETSSRSHLPQSVELDEPGPSISSSVRVVWGKTRGTSVAPQYADLTTPAMPD